MGCLAGGETGLIENNSTYRTESVNKKRFILNPSFFILLALYHDFSFFEKNVFFRV